MFYKTLKAGARRFYVDATPSFERLNDYFDTQPIPHNQHYAEGDLSTNWIESFFSRVRVGERIYRHISGRPGAPHLLDAYAAEMAWRENNRKESNGALYELAIHAAMTHPPSEFWCGYWQRRRPPILMPDTPQTDPPQAV